MQKEQKDIPILPIAKVEKILTDEELPLVTVIIPCYKRKKFVALMMCNLFHMDYPKSKIEVCILQDGPEDLLNLAEVEYLKKRSGVREVKKKNKKILEEVLVKKEIFW